MKRKTSKEILADSFRELAKTKSIDKITIRDITDNCGYSPATFYRQFRDKYDLIAWAYTRDVASIMEQIGSDGFTWEQALIVGAECFEQEKDYLANLLLHTNGHDSFVSNMLEINYNALKKHILMISGNPELDEQIEMYIRVYCLGTVAFTCEWILGKYKVTPGELAVIYRNSLPVPLHEYLI